MAIVNEDFRVVQKLVRCGVLGKDWGLGLCKNGQLALVTPCCGQIHATPNKNGSHNVTTLCYDCERAWEIPFVGAFTDDYSTSSGYSTLASKQVMEWLSGWVGDVVEIEVEK